MACENCGSLWSRDEFSVDKLPKKGDHFSQSIFFDYVILLELYSHLDDNKVNVQHLKRLLLKKKQVESYLLVGKSVAPIINIDKSNVIEVSEFMKNTLEAFYVDLNIKFYEIKCKI